MKKIFIFIFTLILSAYFLIYPKEAVEASSNGLTLWFFQILPTLLPFSILSNILLTSKCISKKNTKWLILCLGILFGFPIAAKLSADAYKNRLISEEKALALSSCFNQFSPFFICNYVCLLCLKRKEFYLPLQLLLLFSSFSFYLILSIVEECKKNKTSILISTQTEKTASRFQLNIQIIDAGIMNSFVALIKICGYIVIFSILNGCITHLPINKIYQVLLKSINEVSTACNTIGNLMLPHKIKFLIIVAILSFGGISGFFQTASVYADSGLSINRYIIRKLLLTLLTITNGLLLLCLL